MLAKKLLRIGVRLFGYTVSEFACGERCVNFCLFIDHICLPIKQKNNMNGSTIGMLWRTPGRESKKSYCPLQIGHNQDSGKNIGPVFFFSIYNASTLFYNASTFVCIKPMQGQWGIPSMLSMGQILSFPFSLPPISPPILLPSYPYSFPLPSYTSFSPFLPLPFPPPCCFIPGGVRGES